MNKFIFLCFLILSFGCHSIPTWSNASQKDRQSGNFRPDSVYFNSPEFKKSIKESVDVTETIKGIDKR